jgi:hypothetical protein
MLSSSPVVTLSEAKNLIFDKKGYIRDTWLLRIDSTKHLSLEGRETLRGVQLGLREILRFAQNDMERGS